MVEKLLSISEASKLLGVCENTLRDWDIEGKFKAARTLGNHRRYSLDQIREYLSQNIPDYIEPEDVQKEVVEECPEIDQLVRKWKILDCIPKDLDNLVLEQTLAVVLENTSLYYEVVGGQLDVSSNQILWLVAQGVLRSKFLKMVSVQPMRGPCSLVYYIGPENSINSEPVAAQTCKLGFGLFVDADFEKIKDIYADALAKEIDFMIFEKLPRIKDLEAFVTGMQQTHNLDYVKDLYDYVILPETYMTVFEDKSIPGVDIYYIPTCLDRDSFHPVAVGGKYPMSNLARPIFAPYVLLAQGAITLASTRTAMTRCGWY